MNGIQNKRQTRTFTVFLLSFISLMVFSCARMGSPDGGWYDETPPKVLSATPKDGATNVKTKKIKILFDEYIKIDNPSEKVIISPPQIEAADIKAAGKQIVIDLKDTLLENTTYTIDFSDAISDNNENNPMGNFTYSFSTGEVIDTLEVSGYVLEAENLEPVKGIMVGLYKETEDSIQSLPMQRISRTDGSGHFVIKGVAPGSYRIYALQDADENYYFNPKSEKIAFTDQIVVPSAKPDIRQDTVWRDSLHIETINRIGYTHFLPDDIELRAFTHIQTDRYLVKTERKEPDHFTFYFSYGSEWLPDIKGLNFDETDAFVIDTNEKQDTITYWLRDTTLINQDTLRMEVQFVMTDTLGELQLKTDTMEMLSKIPYAKRLKLKQKEFDEWKKTQEKAKKKGDPYDSIMPPPSLNVKINVPQQLDPDVNIRFTAPCPLEKADSSMIHLYAKHDTLWYESRFLFRQLNTLEYELVGEWRPEIEYSLEIDSAAFVDIYGNVSKPSKNGFKVKSNDDYSTLLVTVTGMNNKTIVVQLLSGSDAVVKQVSTDKGYAEFYYIKPGEYYMRMFIDENLNGKWDTGDFEQQLQPEPVYYYPSALQCKAKWDVSETWNPLERKLFLQKPSKLVKQKADKKKTVRNRNAERAKQKGIELPANLRK